MKKLNLSLFVSVSPLLILLMLGSEIVSAQNHDKKVLLHYMVWYGDGELGTHWEYGHANTPLIGYYDSRKWSLLTYHMLLSWAHGIDGLIINIKDSYDEETLDMLVPTINKLHHIDSLNFNYFFSISYDDQGMPNVCTAKLKLTNLRDNILPNTNSFLYFQDKPIIFVFDYKNKYLTAKNYRDALDSVFTSNMPKLFWNEIDSGIVDYVDAFYPWVQPDYNSGGWDTLKGLEWGKNYLSWFYDTASNGRTVSNLAFVCGGVWAGFDDRKNENWGKDRWMARQNGTVYDSTWLFINNYHEPKPLNWVIIETWNDWNEGSEIEPSVEDSYKYLDLTTDNVNTFKGTSLRKDSWKKEVAYLIYRLGDLIESKPIDFTKFYPLYENSIRCYLQHGRDNLMHNANDIVDVDSIKAITSIDIAEPQLALPNEFALCQNYPNPFNPSTQISYSIPNANFVTLKIYDVLGREVQTLVDNFQVKGTYFINFDANQLSSGIYFYKLQAGNDLVETRKMLLMR